MLKRSPYFYPTLFAFLSIFVLLVWSGLRIAARSAVTAAPVYEPIVTTRPRASMTPRPKPPLSPVAAKKRDVLVEAGKAALEKTWDLRSATAPPETAEGMEKGVGEGQKETEQVASDGPKVRSEEELQAAKARFEELMRETEGMDTDQLTRMLNDAYRGA